MFSANAYFPLLLGDVGDEENTNRESFSQRVFLFKQLPQQECDFIASEFVTDSLRTLEKKFLLSNEDIQSVTRIIRRFYFKELSQEETLLLLEKNIFSKHPQKEDVLSFVQRNLLSYVIPEEFTTFSPQQEKRNVSQRNIISLSLKKALEKYPRILNGVITDLDITFRGSNGPVTPTLKNWITAYHQEIGSGTHEPFERSQFLFHNENAVKLTQRERNILSEFLRSLDEGSELPINIDTQTIDFATIEKKFNAAERSEIPTQSRIPSRNFEQRNIPQENFSMQHDENISPPPPRNIPPTQRFETAFYARTPVYEREEPVWNPAKNTKPATQSKESFGNLSQKFSEKPISAPKFLEQDHFFQKETLSSITSPIKKEIAPQKGGSRSIMAETPHPQASLSQKDFTDYHPLSPKKISNSQQPSVAANISFSSSHIFPAEKKEEQDSSQIKNTVAQTKIQKRNLLIG